MHRFQASEETLLLSYLLQVIPGIKRGTAKKLLSEGRVSLNGEVVTKGNTFVSQGTLIEIAGRSHESLFKSPYLRIVYEDRWLIVIEKNIGILSMASPHCDFCVKTLLDNYFSQCHSRARAHVVHRLDRETSGLLVYAKTIETQQIFEKNWRELVQDRRYYALVEGHIQQSEGTITSWLKDNKSFVSFSSAQDNGGKLAITHYRILNQNETYSLVELKLDTGRKNQIRVHLKTLDHPIIGDRKYGSCIDPIHRLCLHAFRLGFTHPYTRESLFFETPYPRSFAKLIKGPKP